MNASGLELDHESHVYRFGGEPVAGVSEILTSLGLVDRSVFTDWSRDRGIAVHAAIEYHLTGELDWSTVDSRIKGYVDAALNFLKDAGVQAGPGTFVERAVWHPAWRYAGTPDLIAVAFGRESLIDWKSGGLGTAGLATAAYEMAARIAFPPADGKPRYRLAVQLHENGTYKKCDDQKSGFDPFDYPHFQSCAALFNRFLLPKKKAAMKARAHEFRIDPPTRDGRTTAGDNVRPS